MIDLNSKKLKLTNDINNLIDQALTAAPQKPRPYLGASIVGSSCERLVQYHLLSALGDDIAKKEIPGRTMRIFDRGFTYEEKAIRWMKMAGFVFDGHQLGIDDFNGTFKGHCDGIIVAGPDVGVTYPCLWECKCLQEKGFNAIKKDGLAKYSQSYWAQIHLYMAYLELDSCLYTVVNANTMEMLHLSFEKDLNVARQYRQRVERLLNATKLGELVPRISTDRNYFECKWCGCNKECWGE